LEDTKKAVLAVKEACMALVLISKLPTNGNS
jgi:hypothetical protein